MDRGYDEGSVHEISVVIPVYQGEQTLADVLAELGTWHEPFLTPEGHRARVVEVLLVHDCGPDRSDRVIREAAEEHDWVRPVWLSRNFGQHAATLAGMSASLGDWVVTLDEDGQHDPGDLGAMLDRAMAAQADVVYAAPVNAAPHGVLRNTSSRLAKRLIGLLSGRPEAASFHSYRLILGDVARSVAAYAGSGVYLDIALGWVSRRVTTAPVRLRAEDRASGYGWRTLLSHSWRMVVTGGTRALRAVSLLGILFALVGFLLTAFVVWARLSDQIEVSGWASTMVAVLLSSGLLLFTMGIVAEYLGVAVNMAMGKPLYLVVQDRADGPLARPRPRPRP